MSEDAKEALAWVVIALVGAVGGFFAAMDIQERHWRNDAVTHGKAEYFLDAQHNKEWRWLP